MEKITIKFVRKIIREEMSSEYIDMNALWHRFVNKYVLDLGTTAGDILSVKGEFAKFISNTEKIPVNLAGQYIDRYLNGEESVYKKVDTILDVDRKLMLKACELLSISRISSKPYDKTIPSCINDVKTVGWEETLKKLDEARKNLIDTANKIDEFLKQQK